MTRRARRGHVGWSPVEQAAEEDPASDELEAVELEAQDAWPEEPDAGAEDEAEYAYPEPRRSPVRRRRSVVPPDEESERPRFRLPRVRVPWLKVAAVLLLLVGLGSFGVGVVKPWIAGTTPTSYTTAKVTSGPVVDQSVATGSVSASTVYGLRFGANPDIVSSTSTTSGSGGTLGSVEDAANAGTLSWPVKTVAVTQGQKVKQGDVLATADSSDAEVARLLAQANLSAAQARLSADQASGKASDATILGDQAQVVQAQSAYEAASSAVNLATIVAPADGLVTAVNVLPKVTAPSSGYAIEISAGPMVATASFAESDVNNLAVSQAATVSVTAVDATVPGVVSDIAPSASTSASGGTSATVGGQSSVVSYAVRVTLTSPPDTIKAGMSATITVTTASASDVLRVPATAVAGTATSGYTVRVVDSGGSVSSESVGVGLVTSTYVEITQGLALGETVVTGTSATRSGTSAVTGGFGLPGGGLFGR